MLFGICADSQNEIQSFQIVEINFPETATATNSWLPGVNPLPGLGIAWIFVHPEEKYLEVALILNSNIYTETIQTLRLKQKSDDCHRRAVAICVGPRHITRDAARCIEPVCV